MTDEKDVRIAQLTEALRASLGEALHDSNCNVTCDAIAMREVRESNCSCALRPALLALDPSTTSTWLSERLREARQEERRKADEELREANASYAVALKDCDALRTRLEYSEAARSELRMALGRDEARTIHAQMEIDCDAFVRFLNGESMDFYDNVHAALAAHDTRVAAEAERKALERALAVVFLRCQPDHGDLFAAIDDEIRVLADALERSKPLVKEAMKLGRSISGADPSLAGVRIGSGAQVYASTSTTDRAEDPLSVEPRKP